LLEQEGYAPEIVVHLRPTAPLRTNLHIDQAIELLLRSSEADSVRSVCQASAHPLKMWAIEDDWLRSFVPEEIYRVSEAYNQPRQQLPHAFIQNGSVDVVRTRIITELNSMTGRRIKPFVMDQLESVNIDSSFDWIVAESLMRPSLDKEAIR